MLSDGRINQFQCVNQRKWIRVELLAPRKRAAKESRSKKNIATFGAKCCSHGTPLRLSSLCWAFDAACSPGRLSESRLAVSASNRPQ